MRHTTWDYLGWRDIALDLDFVPKQEDWDLTIYNAMCSAFDFDTKYNIYCCDQILEIMKDNAGFDQQSMSLFGNRIRILTFTTPKIYVTPIDVTDFTMIEHDNYSSVVVKNYVTY